MTRSISRRRVLRGILDGVAVGVALPLLDCFLNGNGTALASGAPLPIRFGTWFWGCGVNPTRWIPDKVGADYDIKAELKAIEPYKKQISILSGYDVLLDGQPNIPHFAGWIGLRSGTAPGLQALPAPSFDVLISDAIGTGMRFRSLEITANGDPRNTLSGRGNGNMNPSENSPAGLYTRIYGSEFQDPNAGNFKPDPQIMARKSVLSGVLEQRKKFEAQLGAADRARLDQYFSTIRDTESQLALLLEKPAPNKACVVPQPVTRQNEAGSQNNVNVVLANHEIMSKLLAMALACNQTRVFNMMYSDPASTLTKPGSTIGHHQMTHEEPVDVKLGYQPGSTWFVERSMEAWGTFVRTLAGISEGDGTLLDNTLLFAHTEVRFAKDHSIDGLPMMVAGRAGGKIRSGLHIDGKGLPATVVPYTLMQAMGLPMDTWGSGRLKTSKVVTELLV